jgi:hypothetical protein
MICVRIGLTVSNEQIFLIIWLYEFFFLKKGKPHQKDATAFFIKNNQQ